MTIQEPEIILGDEDGAAYRRFLNWSLGAGFDLAIVRVSWPVDRNSLIAWTKQQAPQAHEIDLTRVGPGKSRLWDLLREVVDDGATVLLLYGLEETEARQRIIAQLNVERDELVKAFSLPWILFVHPHVYSELLNKAPDFVDFAGVWLQEAPKDRPPSLHVEMPVANAAMGQVIAADEGAKEDLLARATEEIAFSFLDNARDLLARYDLQPRQESVDDLDGAFARCLHAFLDNRMDDALGIVRKELLPALERLSRARVIAMIHVTDILQQRGEPDEAWDILQRLLPIVERSGNERARAITLGRIGNILESRGELDEALHIYTQELIPLFGHLGDAHWQVHVLGDVARILRKRGDLDEALRLLREVVLPVHERVGDERSRAIALGQVADILEEQGEWDEALRVRRQEELPVHERLGDVRARAITLGNVATILIERGELDEASKILQDEVLPAFEQVQDVHGRAVALRQVASVLIERGEFDEAFRILRERVIPVHERLGNGQALVASRSALAITLLQRGRAEDRPEAVQLLRLALHDARRLQLPTAQALEFILRQIGEDPDATTIAQ